MAEVKLVEGWSDKLYDWQKVHAKRLLRAVLTHRAAADASDTGTGKTAVALAVAKALGVKPLIVCPLAVIPSWKRMSELIGVELYGCINYEMLRRGTTDYAKKHGKEYSFNKEILFVIFDEAHRCGGRDTQNANLLTSAFITGRHVLLLSATLADDPLRMKAAGTALRLFGPNNNFWQWVWRHGVKQGQWGGVEFNKDPRMMKRIHEQIFPEKGSRIRIDELGNLFPETLIIPECYDVGEDEKIQQIYDEMEEYLKKWADRKAGDADAENPLTKALRARQKIELLKVPAIAQMAEDAVAEGSSVAIFLNYRDSVEAMAKKVGSSCIIQGGQDTLERQKNIDDFNSGECKIIVLNIAAGGVGISLHDTEGTRPRLALICPCAKSTDLKQALGRVHRAGGKSKSIQKIVFADCKAERDICKNVQVKLQNLDALNDGDLAGGLKLI